MKNIFAIVLAVFAFAYAQVTWSQTPSPGAGWVQGVSATGQKVWFGPSTVTKSSAAMGQAIWDAAMSGGGAKVTTTAKLAVGAGEAAVVAKGVATGASVFAGFRAATGGPLGIALLAAPAIIDWLKQGGVRSTPKGANHSQPFEISDPDACASNCFEYVVFDGGFYSAPSSSPMGAAKLYAARQSGSSSNSSISYVPTSCNSTICSFTVTQYIDGVLYGTTNATANLQKFASGPRPSSWLPSSMDDIAPYMTDRAASAAAIQAMLDHNASIKITSPSVTGPASVTGPETKKTTPIPKPPNTTSSTTTSGNPHGLSDNAPTVTSSSTGSRDLSVDGKPVSVPTKSTTTSTYNPTTNKTTSETVTSSDPHTVTTTTTPKTDIKYSTGTDPKTGDTVATVTGTTVTNTVTNITNNVTNVTTTTTTTETKPETPSEEKEKEDYTFNDSELGEIPELYKRKYEDGITGVWNEKIAAIKATPLFTLGRDIMPSLASSGTCPTFTVPLDLAGWASYGTADVSPPCWVWDFGKVVIVVSSLLLARRLIFGG